MKSWIVIGQLNIDYDHNKYIIASAIGELALSN